MEYIEVLRRKLGLEKFELLIEWSFFLIFIAFLLKANLHSNLFFHTSIELFINVIFLLVFVFTFNTYRINKNKSLLILGTGYFFVSAIGIIHLLTYPGMPFIAGIDATNVSAQLWVTARYVEVFTCLFLILSIFKPNNKINPYFLFIEYLFVTIFLISLILIYKAFPTCHIGEIGLTNFKIISEYVIFLGFIIAGLTYFRFRNKVDKYLFYCLECFFVLSAIAEIFFTNFMSVSDWSNVTGHIIKVIAAYFLYKGVVEAGIRRPYTLLNSSLGEIDNKARVFEQIITQNEQCAKMLINNSDNAVFVLSDYKFVFANQKMADLLGVEL